ncbi:host-nuclease inhibitor Gam family protein [Mammaliicoccus sciuri]|uniref:host-nuclease inhibitor Gam family protein n=1 Tax=Mammaliicoccus sciuri TaxID=1296 RepID=UPI0037A0F1A1
MVNQLIEQELENTEVEESFKIKDLETANWALKKIAAINAKQKEISDLAEKEIEKIEAWRNQEISKYDNSKEGLESLLVEYYRVEKEKDSKFKLSTPYGKVTSRKGTKKWEIPNKERIIETLKARGFNDLIRTKEDINLADMKKQFNVTDSGHVIDSNGETLEGAYVTENPTSYSIKVGD